MKKFLLTLTLIIFTIISSFSQSFIDHNKDYIIQDIGTQDIKSFSYENNVLGLTFTDNHSAIYILDNYEVCKYYIAIYDISLLTSAVEHCNSIATSIGNYRWIMKDDNKYVYIKINKSSKKDDVMFVSFFKYEDENNINVILGDE